MIFRMFRREQKASSFKFRRFLKNGFLSWECIIFLWIWEYGPPSRNLFLFYKTIWKVGGAVSGTAPND